MKLDLLPPDSWENFQSALLEKLELPVGADGLRVYRGVGHALFEAVVSLAQLYPHKRSLVVVEGASPYFEPQLKYFSKEGYEILRLSPDDLSDEACKDKVSKECLFVLAAEDHAVTGELFDFSALEEAATQQRVFCLRLSHSSWRQAKQQPLGKYSLQIRSLSPDLAIICHGSRFKTGPLIAQQMYWPPGLLQEALRLGQEQRKPSENLVSEFESGLPPGVKAFLPPGTKRLFDRSVVVLDQLSADAVAEELAEQLGISSPAPPGEALVDTPNQCRWGELRWQDWWTHRVPSEEQFRGLLVLDQELLAKKDFREAFEKSLEAIRKLQSFST